MKIRADFITNSSSSSFVINMLKFQLQCNKCKSYNTEMVFIPEGEKSYSAYLECKDCETREDLSDWED